jgi:hypothetical protein
MVVVIPPTKSDLAFHKETGEGIATGSVEEALVQTVLAPLVS